MKTFTKDPVAEKDYTWDWTLWLGDDNIDTFVLDVPSDLIEVASIDDGKMVTVWFSGGTDDKANVASCTINTEEGRKDKKSILFLIKPQ